MTKTNDELIDSIFALSQEKRLSTQVLLTAVEESIKEVVGQTKGNIPIDVTINPDTGCIYTYIVKSVVENPEEIYEISLEDALKTNPEVKVGEHIKELLESGSLTSMTFMRTAASSVRKLMKEKISRLEKDREYEAFENQEGTMTFGKIKRFEFGNIILDLKNGEGYLPSAELIPGEHFKMHEEVKAYIYQVKNNDKGPQVLLSRKHPGFLEGLFEEIIPEVNDKIFVKAIARDAGSKSKVAVISTDEDIDAIGSCIGKGGMRIKTIMDEIFQEKIDVVNWSEDIATFAVNSIEPAKVVRVIVKGEQDIELVVNDDDISIAIGRAGQNVRLTRQLIKSKLTITSESDYEAKQQQILDDATEQFSTLGLSEENIQALVASEIVSFEILKGCYVEDIKESGVDLSEAEIQRIIKEADKKHIEYCHKKAEELGSKINLGISTLNISDAAKLAESGILTDEAVADLDTEEMASILRDLRKFQINEIIMDYRRDAYDLETHADSAINDEDTESDAISDEDQSENTDSNENDQVLSENNEDDANQDLN